MVIPFLECTNRYSCLENGIDSTTVIDDTVQSTKPEENDQIVRVFTALIHEEKLKELQNWKR